MSPRLPENEFIHRLFALLTRARFSQRYKDACETTVLHLKDAEELARNAARNPNLVWSFAPQDAKAIREAYEKAEKAAREAASIAKAAKERAAAVEAMAAEQKQAIDEYREKRKQDLAAAKMADYGDHTSDTQDPDTEAARTSGEPEGPGGQDAPEAA